jgi:hypothetical protein
MSLFRGRLLSNKNVPDFERKHRQTRTLAQSIIKRLKGKILKQRGLISSKLYHHIFLG